MSSAILVDGVSDKRRRDTSMLIRDGRIVAIAASVEVPDRAQRIELHGSYVMTGLLNMHTHLSLSLHGSHPAQRF